jgi:hypothetical protein
MTDWTTRIDPELTRPFGVEEIRIVWITPRQDGRAVNPNHGKTREASPVSLKAANQGRKTVLSPLCLGA